MEGQWTMEAFLATPQSRTLGRQTSLAAPSVELSRSRKAIMQNIRETGLRFALHPQSYYKRLLSLHFRLGPTKGIAERLT